MSDNEKDERPPGRLLVPDFNEERNFFSPDLREIQSLRPLAPVEIGRFGEERCVMPKCGKPTGYSHGTPADDRACYVEGAGQLCPGCYSKVYPRKQSLEDY